MSVSRSWCTFLLVIMSSTLLSATSFESTFKQCLISSQYNHLGHCLGMGALTKLQSLDSEPEFDLVDGFTLMREPQQREAFNFAERDPTSIRSIVDSFGHVFAQRNMRWDMGSIYPGLQMQIVPSAGVGGMLEFALDPHRESLNVHTLKEAATGTVLARQFLVPLLLGFKFNVITIIPIIFGLLALIAKKAVILSKIALIISSAFGLGTLLLNNGNKYGGYHHQGPAHFPGGGYGGHFNRFPEHGYDPHFRTNTENVVPTNDEIILPENLQALYDREDETKGRNFAWNEQEKLKKKTQ